MNRIKFIEKRVALLANYVWELANLVENFVPEPYATVVSNLNESYNNTEQEIIQKYLKDNPEAADDKERFTEDG